LLCYNFIMAIENKTKNKIVNLYKDFGLSSVQIAQKLGITDPMVRYWLTKRNVKKRSISEAINNLYRTKFKKKPFQLKKCFSKNDTELKISGIMLYWGEGAKTGNSIKFANSDPEMIKIFLNFLRNICGIHEKRLKLLMHIYPDQDEDGLRKFWSSMTKVSKKQFYRSHIHKGKKGTYKNKSRYGTLAINYSDKKLLNTLLSWIEQYKKRLI
jgi:hypothetical protein